MPLFAREPARRRRGIEVAFGLRHPSRALMARNIYDGARCLAVRAIGPWTGQLPVLVTVLGTGFHSRMIREAAPGAAELRSRTAEEQRIPVFVLTPGNIFVATPQGATLALAERRDWAGEVVATAACAPSETATAGAVGGMSV